MYYELLCISFPIVRNPSIRFESARQSYCNYFAIALQSLLKRSIVPLLLCHRFTTAVYCFAIALQSLFMALQSLCENLVIALRSLCNQVADALQLFCNRLVTKNIAIALPSLCDCSLIVLPSLCHRSAIALLSLCYRSAIA
jgi:hypothetical protein